MWSQSVLLSIEIRLVRIEVQLHVDQRLLEILVEKIGTQIERPRQNRQKPLSERFHGLREHDHVLAKTREVLRPAIERTVGYAGQDVGIVRRQLAAHAERRI